MAITKIHAIKSTLGKALAYIENPDKTDGQMLVSGYNCEPQTASIDFEVTAVLSHKARNLKRKRSTNLAYHLIQSFSPEDAVTPEQAHELGKKLAFEYTGGKYEYVVATHIDKGHIFVRSQVARRGGAVANALDGGMRILFGNRGLIQPPRKCRERIAHHTKPTFERFGICLGKLPDSANTIAV